MLPSSLDEPSIASDAASSEWKSLCPGIQRRGNVTASNAGSVLGWAVSGASLVRA